MLRNQIFSSNRPTSTSSIKKQSSTTQSVGSFPRFSLRTEPKSQASTYFSLNNAVRTNTIKLDENETKAYQQTKDSNSRRLLGHNDSKLQYCSSYSKGKLSSATGDNPSLQDIMIKPLNSVSAIPDFNENPSRSGLDKLRS